ncbi:MAG TPA: hypothetical protein VMT37_08500 [Solirubrobacterales bacterium]|nr:hypothetical protein [Solirubrobacterales bacterium]
MKRRGLIVGVVVVILASLTAAAGADAPPGPRLAFIRLAKHPAALELQSADAVGQNTLRLVGGGSRDLPLPYPLSGVSWSADGSMLAFAAVRPRGGHRRGRARPSIYVIAADGGAPTLVAGSSNAVSPVFAPDGHTVAFLRVRGVNRSVTSGHRTHQVSHAESAIWLADLGDGGARRLTPWRRGSPLWPTSFSPDGAQLLGSRADGTNRSHLVSVDVADGAIEVWSRRGADPVYSPDGAQIAFLRPRVVSRKRVSRGGASHVEVRTAAEIFVMKADGSELAQITHTDSIDEYPSWDPSGSRLVFARLATPLTENAIFGIGDTVMEVNADGSCPTRVLSQSGVGYIAPAWQPGADRAAGPISC